MDFKAMTCTCGLEARPEIWLCPHHRYFKDGREYTSASTVIKAVCPTDYSKIAPIVLEIARIRGSMVDQYFSDWLENPDGVVSLREVREMITPMFPVEGKRYAVDTIKRIAMLLDWWLDEGFSLVDVQRIVYSEQDGIATTMDVRTLGLIMDLKCTSQLYPAYQVQLGAHSSYANGEAVGNIWVTSKKVKLVRYDADDCRRQWRAAVEEFNKLACD